MPYVCSNKFLFDMRRLFRIGDRVRSKRDGRVMEVLKYLKSNLLELRWFDVESREVRHQKLKEDQISRAA